MTALSTLRARVEACGAGGDREIDLDLAKFLGEAPANAKFDECGRIFTGSSGAFMFYAVVPPYTSSIDTALALAERKLKEPHFTFSGPAKYLNIPSAIPNYWWAQIVHDYPGQTSPRGWGATAPLALLSALLRALEGQDT